MINDCERRFNAYGEEIIKGKVYYHRQTGEQLVTKKARRDYTCDTCGQSIYWGNLYAKSGAKFDTDKYCLDCASPFEPSIESVLERS